MDGLEIKRGIAKIIPHVLLFPRLTTSIFCCQITRRKELFKISRAKSNWQLEFNLILYLINYRLLQCLSISIILTEFNQVHTLSGCRLKEQFTRIKSFDFILPHPLKDRLPFLPMVKSITSTKGHD